MFRRFKMKNSVNGATMIEYALIASLIAMICIGGFRRIGSSYGGMYNNIANAFDK